MTINLRTVAAGLLAAAILTGAGAAEAALVTVTFSGTVTYSDDYTGEFGRVGGDGQVYNGMTATSVYVFDSALGDRTTGPTYDVVSGGSLSGLSNPIISATFSLNNVSQTVDPGRAGQARVNDNPGNLPPFGVLFLQQDSVFDIGGPLELFRSMTNQIILPTGGSTSLETSFSATTLAGFEGSSFGQFFDAAQMGGNVLRSTFIQYQVTGVTLEGVAQAPTGGGAVPEPASWALMIAGFGLAGAALRRGRPAVA